MTSPTANMLGWLVRKSASTLMRPARIGLDARGRKVQLVDITLPPDRVEQRVARNLLLALQRRDHASAASSTLSTSSFSRIVVRLSRR